MTKLEMAKAILAHAEANYTKGWDTYVEAWGLEGILEDVEENDYATLDEAITSFGHAAEVWLSRQEEAAAYREGTWW